MSFNSIAVVELDYAYPPRLRWILAHVLLAGIGSNSNRAIGSDVLAFACTMESAEELSKAGLCF